MPPKVASELACLEARRPEIAQDGIIAGLVGLIERRQEDQTSLLITTASGTPAAAGATGRGCAAPWACAEAPAAARSQGHKQVGPE